MTGKTFLKRDAKREDGWSVAAVVRARAKEEPPLLAWAEPEPTWHKRGIPGRVPDFRPLTTGIPDWPDDVPLVEARLFWGNKVLHVIATETGCHWASVEEVHAGAEQVRKDRKPVLAIQDKARFGLGSGDLADCAIDAVEYRRNGRLVGWRLVPMQQQDGE